MFHLFSCVVIYLVSGIFSRPVSDTPPYPFLSEGCPEIRVNYSVSENESAGYTVDFELKGGNPPYKLVFYKASGKLVSSDFTKTTFSGLNSGEYQVTAIDQKNCRVTQKIQLP